MAKVPAAAAALTAFPFGSARQLAAAIRGGKVTALELLKAYLARVDELNPALNAVVVDDREVAMKTARAADRAVKSGKRLGPLHGVPMTVKESFAITGHPVTFGQPAMADNVLDRDAVVVERLRAAGAVIFGKTNVPLNLADFQSYNEVYGTTNNPWDPALAAGGSSGGSGVAMAAGLSGLEFGSDIGGSIRNPAAYNGVYGHKPTFGIIPKRGHTLSFEAVAETAISVVGPLARSAADLALALKVTAGPDLEDGYRLALPAPPTSLKGLRVAVWLDQPDLSPVDDEVQAHVRIAAEALGRAGAKVDFTARPDFDPVAANDVYQLLLLATMSARDPNFDALVAKAEALDAADTGPYARNLRMSVVRHRDYVLAEAAQANLRWTWRRFFADHDVVLAPITATPPFPHDHSEPMAARTMTVNGQEVPYLAQVFWAGLAIAAHLPSTVAPTALSADGLPIGVQIMGDAYRDRTTIWVAEQLARLVGGFQPPPI
ncbi:MAG: amidase [Desertimonas sp.]